MSKPVKIAIVTALLVTVVVLLVYKKGQRNAQSPESGDDAVVVSSRNGGSAVPASLAAAELPRLVDLGGSECKLCKMMAPILTELAEEYAGRLKVDVIDVQEAPDIARSYGIRGIPTQIFYDAAGAELWRHWGFLSKQDILDKWKELGVDLTSPR